MSRDPFVAATTAHGSISVTPQALAQVVATALEESYGVVGRGGGRMPRLGRRKGTKGIVVRSGADGIEVTVTVVVEYGLKLSEVAAVVQDRVRYEIERRTGLEVASVDVRIDDARKS